MDAASISRWHGLFNALTGAWPLVHMPSFEAVSGPKVDRWLVRTVGGLLVVNGLTQLSAGTTEAATALSRRLGLGTALTLAVIDIRYASTRRIRRIYLLDAVVELAWAAVWASTLLSCPSSRRSGVGPGDRRRRPAQDAARPAGRGGDVGR